MRSYVIFVMLAMGIFFPACGTRSEPISTATIVRSPGASTPVLPTVSFCSFLPEVSRKLPTSKYELYRKHSVLADSVFLQYVYAIVWNESGFNPKARSTKDAYGLMQMTQIAMLEAAAYCHLPVLRSMDKLLDPGTNIKYGTCYLKFLHEQTENDWVRTLITYNGGYRQLTRYDSGSTIAAETAQYVLAVNRVRKLCSANGTEVGNESGN